MGENGEILRGLPSEPPELVYVAVGKRFKKNVKNLRWSVRNFPDAKIVIVHVHDPRERAGAALGEKLYRSIFKAHEADAPKQRSQEETMGKVIQQYLSICATEKKKSDKLVVESDSVEKGILELVARHDIRKLVMGAASDSKYDRKMIAPTSDKARYVKAYAPPHCQIWFVCNGYHICTREPSPLQKMRSFPLPPSTNPFLGEEDNCRTPSSLFQAEPSNSPQLAEGSLSRGVPARTLSLMINGLAVEGDDSKSETGSISFRQLAEANLAEDSLAEEQRQRKEAEENQRLLELLKEKDDRIAQLSREKAEIETALTESDRILKLTNEQLQASQSSLRGSSGGPSFAEFTLGELAEATRNFHPSSQIGKGGFGAVYKGKIRRTTVAIKKLNPDCIQGATEFQQEVDILTRVRHPNLITLIGACSQAGCLVYEYLSNGSLEDRLLRRSRTAPPPPPLTWRDRVRIATQIYSVLFFLHSAKPYTIVHGDLKPANILLDANLDAKIGDFGICRLLPHQESAATILHTDPKGTYAYVDPQFMATGELTVKYDVYAFGVIILQLLTAKPGTGLANEVRKVLSSKKLHEVLDPAAGKWPSKEAMQLVNLGLLCCEMESKNRPDLESDIWKVLQ